MSAVKAAATDATSAVAVMADAVAVADQMADRKAALAVKPGQKVVLRDVVASAVSAAPSHEVNNVLINAATNVVNSAAINALKAKSSASHAHHANLEKVVAPSAQGVNVVSAPSVVTARRVMPQSKTSPWPTRPRWQRQRAALQLETSRIGLTAVHAHNAVNAMAGAMTAAASAKTQAMHHKPSKLPTLMQRRSRQPGKKAARKTTNSASRANHVSAAAATVMAANAVSARTVLKALKALNEFKTSLKTLFLLKIQYQMWHQTSKYGRKQLLNL